MTIFNQNWIGFNGEPITGKTPARVVVHTSQTGQPVSKPLEAELFHAYKLFCDAVAVSAFPAGYHVQNRRFADGSRVRMESINGVHKVQLWPATVDDDGEGFSGIGIAFTLLDGTPLDEWKVTVPKPGGEVGETEEQPQPLILTPVPAPGARPYVSSGRWRIEKVPELIGGQHLWVSTSRRDWTSSLMETPFATPFPVAHRQLPTLKNARNNDLWVKRTASRIVGRTITGEGPTYLTADYSTYSFKGGDSVIYKPNVFTSPVFTHTPPNGESRFVAVRSTGNLLLVYSGPRTRKKGLHKNDAIGAGEVVSGSYTEITRPTPHFFETSGVHPSPDGEHFVVGTSDAINGGYCIGTVDGEGVSVAYDNVPLVNSPYTNTYLANTNSSVTTAAAVFTTSTVGPTVCPPPGGTPSGTMDIQNYVGLEQSVSTSASLNTGGYGRSETLESISYGADGALVPVVIRTVTDTQLQDTSSYDDLEGTRTQVNTANSYTDWVAPKRTLRTNSNSFSVNRSHTGNAGDPVGAVGSVVSTERTVLFYDHDLDFIVYLEDAVNVTLAVPPLANWIDPYLTETGVTTTRQLSVRARLGAAEVFAHTITAPVSFRFNNLRGPDVVYDYDTSVTDVEYQYTTFVEEFCVEEPSVAIKVPVDASITGSITSVTGTATFAQADSYVEEVPTTGRPRPNDYFHVEFARDPRTLAVIVNLQFRGADFGHGNENESWIWAVDQTGFKTLNQILNIDAAEKLIVWEKYNFNSLVSI